MTTPAKTRIFIPALTLIVGLFLFTTTATADTLVPNGDFEDVSGLATATLVNGQPINKFPSSSSTWYTTTGTSGIIDKNANPNIAAALRPIYGQKCMVLQSGSDACIVLDVTEYTGFNYSSTGDYIYSFRLSIDGSEDIVLSEPVGSSWHNGTYNFNGLTGIHTFKFYSIGGTSVIDNIYLKGGTPPVTYYKYFINGTVKTNNSIPISSAGVTITTSENTAHMTTDTNGYYEYYYNLTSPLTGGFALEASYGSLTQENGYSVLVSSPTYTYNNANYYINQNITMSYNYSVTATPMPVPTLPASPTIIPIPTAGVYPTLSPISSNPGGIDPIQYFYWIVDSLLSFFNWLVSALSWVVASIQALGVWILNNIASYFDYLVDTLVYYLDYIINSIQLIYQLLRDTYDYFTTYDSDGSSQQFYPSWYSSWDTIISAFNNTGTLIQYRQMVDLTLVPVNNQVVYATDNSSSTLNVANDTISEYNLFVGSALKNIPYKVATVICVILGFGLLRIIWWWDK